MIRLFRVFVPTSVLALLLVDAILILGSYVGAIYYILYDSYDVPTFLYDERGLLRSAIVTLLILLGLYFNDLYTDFRVPSGFLVQQLCLVIGMAFIAQALISYVSRNWIIPKWVMIEGSVLAFVLLFSWRMLFISKVWTGVGQQKILFLGSSAVTFEVADHLVKHPEFGMTGIGYIAGPDGDNPGNSQLKLLGTASDLRPIVDRLRPDRIVVGTQERRNWMPVYDLLELRFAGIQTEEIASLYEVTFGRVCTREIRPSQLIFSSEMGPRRHSLQLQALYSVAVALVALILALPVMALVAILVKFSSPGPVLLRQKRVGLHNRIFTVYKFRSMYQDAEARSGPVWAKRNDPRITPVGYWLRKLRLDELPQLFNVLRREMSIVGPRPERPEFVEHLSEQIPFYRQRHYVMPGITGWAQINYKYGDTIEDTIAKLEYDLYYIKHISFGLDLYIMFHTAKTMLLFRGAQ